jgi:hypothetical protein
LFQPTETTESFEMNLRLLKRLKTRDAAVVYEFLFELLNRSAGSFSETSYERIAADLTRAGILTAREAAFTARVVRSKLDELESVGVVERAYITASSFELFVYMPYPSAEDQEQRAPETGGKTLFDFASPEPVETRSQNGSQNGNENGNGEKTTVAINKELIINKKINKARVKREVFHPEPQAEPEPDSFDGPTTDEVRVRVKFENPKVARFRAEVARRCWEPTTNPDLIDRLVALAVLEVGGTKARDVFGMISDARDSRDRYERTDGRAGRSKIWESLVYAAKRIYETNGWKWTRTKIGSEPRPENKDAEKRAALFARLDAGD